MTSYNVGYFVGSLSTASINRLLSKALIQLGPPELQMTEIPYKDLPLYNRDHDVDYPLVAREFKNSIAAVDAVLFITPEYNRSIPGALKNAIDWASRLCLLKSQYLLIPLILQATTAYAHRACPSSLRSC